MPSAHADKENPIVIETSRMSVSIIPESGKIVSIYDKEKQKEWLWSCNPMRHDGDSFDMRWNGGIDLIFPCDEESTEDGEFYQDHGICWKDQWEVDLCEKGKMILELEVHAFCLRYTIEVCGAELSLSVLIRNQRAQDVLYLFRWHPAFALDTLKTLSYTDNDSVRANLLENLAFLGFQGEYFMESIELSQGSLHLCDIQGRTLRMVYEVTQFPVLTVFASKGGWMGHNVIVPEPSTGKGSNTQEMMETGQGRCLPAGEKTEFVLKISIGEYPREKQKKKGGHIE